MTAPGNATAGAARRAVEASSRRSGPDTALVAGLLALALLGPAIQTRLASAAPDDHSGSAAAPEGFRRAAADSFSAKVLRANRVGITITNYGFVGNNFNSRNPSFEYPLGLGYEHLVRGGLWIGAHAINQDNGLRFTGVTTGTVDGSTADGAPEATEFTPARSGIQVRSTLQNDANFSRDAVSEQDFLAFFDDKTPKRAGNNPEFHRPLKVSVRQENYAWSFGNYQHFVIFHWVIRNEGLPMDSMWVGLYGEMASGPKNSYSTWPPTSAGGGSLGGWFGKKWIAYDDTLRAFMEHYCNAQPIPSACQAERVPVWAGYKLLTPPNVTAQQKVTLAAWKYDPRDTLGVRNEDRERYAIMSAGTINPLVGDSLLPVSGDPIELLALGPFGDALNPINPGDSVVVDFAYIGGATPEDFRTHARTAQRAFDLEYKVPLPPPSPRLKVVARERALDLYWDDTPEFAKDPTSAAPDSQDFEGYRVYLGTDRLAPELIAQFDKKTAPNDTTGFNTGIDTSNVRIKTGPVEIDGHLYQYKFTVQNLRDGFKYFAAVTSYDLGTPEDEPLESGLAQNKTMAIPGAAAGDKSGGDKVTVFPNPYRVEARWDQGTLVRDHYLWFTNLPGKCTIKIFTLSGDLVFETGFDGATYRGDNARGIYDPRRDGDVQLPTLSGRTFGWNLISKDGQAVATGLYLYSVEDTGGKRSVGKFLVVKSDRESF